MLYAYSPLPLPFLTWQFQGIHFCCPLLCLLDGPEHSVLSMITCRVNFFKLWRISCILFRVLAASIPSSFHASICHGTGLHRLGWVGPLFKDKS
jgi:hypothetical protein